MGYAVKLQSRRPNETIILSYGKSNGSAGGQFNWNHTYNNEKYITAEAVSTNSRIPRIITFKKAFKNVLLSQNSCTVTKTRGNFTIEEILKTEATSYSESIYYFVSIKPQDQFTISGASYAWACYALYG